jgi:tRNA splicing ligase
MTCSSCGLFICYVCRETINGYDHFTNNERYRLTRKDYICEKSFSDVHYRIKVKNFIMMKW